MLPLTILWEAASFDAATALISQLWESETDIDLTYPVCDCDWQLLPMHVIRIMTRKSLV
jgi:hypothetical protein